MFLGDLLGARVLENGQMVGYLNDVRMFVPHRTEGQLVGSPQVYGVVVCPRKASSFLGYERNTMNEPRLLASFFAWRTRGSFLVLWEDLQIWNEAGVEIREGARRWSTALA
ncbi:MAG TPA: hypothetical protein VGK17_19405 [Propionicimonas sp.]|jgi:hypothetical protein